MQTLTLFGPAWSAYARTARLILIEKQLRFQMVDVDFSNGDMPPEHLSRHPFGKVPVLQHGGFRVYETVAIGRYLDTAFPNPGLQPTEPEPLARMTQIIAVLDAYVSQQVRIGYVTECLFKPILDLTVDRARASQSKQQIIAGFHALAELVSGTQYLIAEQLTLADLHAIPLFDYLSLTPGGDALIQSQAVLDRWWRSIRARTSVQNTAYDLTIFNPQWRDYLASAAPSNAPQ